MSFLQKLYVYISVGIFSVFPVLALAQPVGAFGSFIGRIRGGLNTIITFFFLVATVMLLYGILKYVSAGDDEDKVADGRRLIVFGITALAVMVALWAFVYVVIDFFFAGRDFSIPGPGDGILPRQ